MIHFSSESSHKIYDVPQINIVKQLLFLFGFKRRQKYERLSKCKTAYEKFRINQLEMDNEELLPENLQSVKDKYDVVVVGSDQVWNVQMGDFDESFFAGWTSKKKVAYAPSLGGKDIRTAAKANQFIQWINEFAYLSVREEIGKKCLEEICDREITKVLDPTLLIEADEWRKLVGKPLIERNYIFFYSWAYCYDDLIEIVKCEKERLGMPVIVVDSRKWMNKDEKKYGFTLSEREGPLAFLNLMYYADRAFVESFHGMVFAYIFKKNFWLLDTHENLDDLDSRLMEFVDLLGAESRILTKFNYFKKDMEVKMDYLENTQLLSLQNISKNYIRKAMEDI